MAVVKQALIDGPVGADHRGGEGPAARLGRVGVRGVLGIQLEAACPFHAAIGRVQGVEIRIVQTVGIDRPIVADRSGGEDGPRWEGSGPLRRKLPQFRAVGVQGIQRAIGRAEIDAAVGCHRW